MSTYLVTGAAGFIASKVCEFLLAEGHTVVGIDNLNDYYDVRLKDYRLARLLGKRYGTTEGLKTETVASELWQPGNDARLSMYAGVGRLERKTLKIEVLKSQIPGGGRSVASDGLGRFVFEPLDIEHLSALERLFKEFKFDAVFNLAARAGVRYSIENPHIYMTTNAHGTLNLLECLRKYNVKKFVLASTSSLYAGCPMPFTEDQPVNTPLSPYAASKKAAEAMTYSYYNLYGIDVSVLRYFTVYGPAGRPDMAPYRFVRWIATGEPIKLFGDGNQTRDFTYVDDIARGTILAARPLGYEVINLGGGGQPITINSMISTLEKLLGKRAKIVHLPPYASDMPDTQADIAKAGRSLGWTPEIAPTQGFEGVVAWYVKNRSWLKKVEVEPMRLCGDDAEKLIMPRNTTRGVPTRSALRKPAPA